ncbi:hypothetical protein BK133_08540 [Paenibacillus sp. FSL H8-0548]|uniref:hypothetical protein n=1 Tax=Paenibacillus sp. FSL H8-0548 TaxID=1920422 RepID=UPI00096D1C52|nr:hypothetical protein [Paenibacillus sp. FSL H8-0548]OMF36685.1 hypothetical protein BK133_08540 [Paenibacillus sp. FSL H8-0548]
MVERILVIVVGFGSMLLYDLLTLKKVSKREKGIYTIACLICLYMGMDFVVNKDWFDFFDLMIPVFEDISKAIDGFLNVNA